jgi:hypothetical protein
LRLPIRCDQPLKMTRASTVVQFESVAVHALLWELSRIDRCTFTIGNAIGDARRNQLLHWNEWSIFSAKSQ